MSPMKPAPTAPGGGRREHETPRSTSERRGMSQRLSSVQVEAAEGTSTAGTHAHPVVEIELHPGLLECDLRLVRSSTVCRPSLPSSFGCAVFELELAER
jgi:hypothetical protein